MSEPGIVQRWPEEVAMLERWLDGEVTQDEFAKLDAALTDSPELALYASQRLAEHRLLGVLHPSATDDAHCAAILNQVHAQQSAEVDRIFDVVQADELSGDSSSASSRVPKLILSALAACAATLFIAAVVRWNKTPQIPPAATQVTNVATM